MIRTHNLTKAFGEHLAVADLNLTVPQGSLTALLGPNGAGKTTTLRLLLGLLEPTRGEIELFGQPPRPEVKARIGYVGEQPSFYQSLNVNETIAFQKSFYPRWNEAILRNCLELFKIDGRARPHLLSKGQKTQFALALALAPEPDLLILDEPTAGLDALAQRNFRTAVIEAAAEAGQTVLLSTHDLAGAERLADRLALLAGGRLIAAGETDELKAQYKRVTAVFATGVPEALLGHPSVVRVGGDGAARHFTLSGNVANFLAALEAARPQFFEVIDLPLEEVFFEAVTAAEGRAQ